MFTDAQFTGLVKKYIDTVFRVSYSYLKNREDAEDVVQNVFLKLYREPKPFDSEDHVRYWLVRVTVNECKTMLRLPWRKQESFEDHAGKLSFPSPEHSDLFYAVMDLPKKYRLPIYLYYYEGYSTQELADILKLPKGTVCVHLKRGREMLKNQLLEDDDQ